MPADAVNAAGIQPRGRQQVQQLQSKVSLHTVFSNTVCLKLQDCPLLLTSADDVLDFQFQWFTKGFVDHAQGILLPVIYSQNDFSIYPN